MKNQNKINQHKKNKISPVIIVLLLILIIYALTLLGMLSWGLLTSLKTTAEYKYRPNNLGGPNIWGLPDTAFSSEYASVMGLSYNLFSNYINILSKFNFTVKKNGAILFISFWIISFT